MEGSRKAIDEYSSQIVYRSSTIGGNRYGSTRKGTRSKKENN